MIKGTKEFLDQVVKTHVCPEHGKKLVVAWHAGENSYVIRCGGGHFPEEVAREKTPTQEYKAGEREPVGKGLDLMPRTDLATGELLAPEIIRALMEYAFKYGLDPYRAHVILMYGEPYITIDGYLWYASRSQSPYQLKSRPLTEEERKTYRVGEDDHAWIAEVIMAEGSKSTTGLGIVTNDEMTAKSKYKPEQLRSPVVAAHPWQLAQKRAEWQALRRAFPIGESESKNEEVS